MDDNLSDHVLVTPDKGIKVRKTQFRFNSKDEIALLIEVIARFPYGVGHGKTINAWNDVHKSFELYLVSTGRNKNCCPAKDVIVKRTNKLLELWKKEEADSLKRSGSDEEFTEKEQLLTDLAAMIKDLEDDRKLKTSNEQRIESEGQVILNAALSTMKARTEKSSPKAADFESGTPAKRSGILSVLKDQQVKDSVRLNLKNDLEKERLSMMEEELEIRRLEASNTNQSLEMMASSTKQSILDARTY